MPASCPANDGVSATQSPRQIVTGQLCDFKMHCMLQFGEYVQVHESHDNSMKSRTTGAIALRPTGNNQGGMYFMSLKTGERINRYAWTQLPMPSEVIDQVHQLACHNPAGGAIEFGWRDGTPIEDQLSEVDDLHDEDFVPSDTSIVDDDLEVDESVDGSEASDADAEDGLVVQETALEVEETSSDEDGGDVDNDTVSDDENEGSGNNDDGNNALEGVEIANDGAEGVAAKMDAKYGARRRSGLRA